MDTLGNPGTTFTQRIAAGLEKTFTVYKDDTAKLTREIELRKDSSRDSYIVDSKKRQALQITSCIGGGGGGGGGGNGGPKNPGGKDLKKPKVTNTTVCFFDVEAKAGIANNKVCGNPCYSGPHQNTLQAYITSAGSKGHLITSVSNFRDKGRVKVLVAAIKAHK